VGLAAVDSALRRGLGKVKPIASVYKVYRLGGTSGTPNAATNIIDPLNLVNSGFTGKFTMGLPKAVIEQEEIYKMLYNGICDTRALKMGDVLLETGPTLTGSPDGRMYALADVQPLMPGVFARCDFLATISRPSGHTTTAEPTLGLGVYQGQSKGDEWQLALNTGVYTFQGGVTASQIPCGMQPYTRLGGPQEFKAPEATRRSTHFAYFPLLPGDRVQAGDVINAPNGDSYQIQNISEFTVGLRGHLALCEKSALV
jgi:hypothetical protein